MLQRRRFREIEGGKGKKKKNKEGKTGVLESFGDTAERTDDGRLSGIRRRIQREKGGEKERHMRFVVRCCIFVELQKDSAALFLCP